MNEQSLEERIAKWLFNSAREASGLPELAEIPHNHAPYWVNKAKELMALIFDDGITNLYDKVEDLSYWDEELDDIDRHESLCIPKRKLDNLLKEAKSGWRKVRE